MTKNVDGNVDKQAWTDAFEARSTEGFEAALAPDVVLNASSLIKPIIGRDLVKVCMQTASTMYEQLTFFAQARSEGRTWLEWKARTFSGLELAGVTVLEINAAGRITSIGIHHRPLEGLLKFSAELGRKVEGKIDESHFYRFPEQIGKERVQR
jgi:hypothetical protein